MNTTTDFSNIIQIANDKTLSISTVKYGETPSIKNIGTANDIKLEITLPQSEQDLDVEIGSVTTGGEPSVKKRLSNGKIYFDFVLPTKGDQGDVGPQGSAATIEIGKVSIGNIAKVENVGTKNNAILNFTLPYASGQWTTVNQDNNGQKEDGDDSKDDHSKESGGFGGDKETAEELKNVTAGINRSAQATEELEETVANILTQIAAMVNQNNIIIRSVVNRSEQLEKSLGDRIDANKQSIKAIQMTTIDKSMIDDTKDRVSACEQTVSMLRGEIKQVFVSEVYRTDKKDIEDRLSKVEDTIVAIKSALAQIDNINDSILRLDSNYTQGKAQIELLQDDIARLSDEISTKQEAGHLVTMKERDAGLTSSIESIDGIRNTANQNTKSIAAVVSNVSNLSTKVQETGQTVADIQTNYAKGDATNKSLIDNLTLRFEGQTKTFNDAIAEIQQMQSDADSEYAHADEVYTRTYIDGMVSQYFPKTGGNITGNLNVEGFVMANSFKGKLAGNADTATTADRAVHDSEGNEIVKTYVTKAEYNGLHGRIEDAKAKAEEAAAQISGFSDTVAGHETEIEKLLHADASLSSRIDSVTEKKANQADLAALQSTVDSDRASNAAEHKALNDNFSKFMLKDAVIQESQIDSKFAKKLDGIASNTNAISQLRTLQEATDAKANQNAEDIAALRVSIGETNDAIERAKQNIMKPKRVSFEAIEAMFAKYMPEETGSTGSNEGGD